MSASWLVDVGYVVKASAGLFKLDYLRGRDFLCQRIGPVAVFLFNGYDLAYGIPAGLQAFYSAMEREGMTVRLHPMASGPPGANRQRGVDVDIAAHLVWRAALPETRVLALTTADQDLAPAVDLCREKYGKDVILFTYSAQIAPALQAAAARHIVFEDHQADLERP